MGPQFGYLFPVGDMQGYLNLKAYGEFNAANRPSGRNTWLTSQSRPRRRRARSRQLATGESSAKLPRVEDRSSLSCIKRIREKRR